MSRIPVLRSIFVAPTRPASNSGRLIGPVRFRSVAGDPWPSILFLDEDTQGRSVRPAGTIVVAGGALCGV